ncbi:unnamed protein product [Eruca vesicaria subsp. sativa]|uniref:FKB95-like N-terminal Kelch domain-containing protein n=1 Tax=Eruca vesicaria subsp. sativa TaxID=29727 RepID=A0ABC8JAA2_ERUVS|nr:unnamed protein product [Eruca vesicaria subsp. sativa]
MVLNNVGTLYVKDQLQALSLILLTLPHDGFSCYRPYRIPKSSNYLMVPVSAHKISPLFWWTCVAIGSTIYTVGKFNNCGISSRVFFLDCRSHTWHEAPSMQMTRMYPLCVIDGKIYIVEGWNVRAHQI